MNYENRNMMNKKGFIVYTNEGVFQKPGTNSRSYTPMETRTMGKLDNFKLIKKMRNENLILRNDENTKYFIIENGIVFKYDESKFSFYRLNLNDYVWESDQTLASLYYDTYLKYQELPYFEDYYPNREDLDLSSGRQR